MAAIEEPDRIDGQPHPRETYELAGQEEALSRAARAIRSGRPPQGWLLAGGPGIGKATLAYRIARYLLRYGATDAGPANLHVGPEDATSRRIEALAHPGLLVLRRPWDEKSKRLKSVITVDEIRRLGEFFGLKSASGDWRVAIIDCADDLHEESANALLKNLEEPPAHSLVILIGHAPGRLLPTIRSRVMRLDLKSLDENQLAQLLARLAPELDPDERRMLARFAEGSLGLALQLAGEEGAQLARDAEALLAIGAKPDWLSVLKLAERVGRRSNELEQYGEFLTQSVSRRILSLADAGRGSERAVELWEQLHALFSRAVAVNLEPRQTVLTSGALISSAHRQRLL